MDLSAGLPPLWRPLDLAHGARSRRGRPHMRGCLKRAGQDDTRAMSPPRWCAALDKDACHAHFSTTIHGEPRLCQWVDVGCRSGNVSLCAAEPTPTNITHARPVVVDEPDHDGMPLPALFAAAALLVVVLLMWRKGRAGSSRGQLQLVATRETDCELEGFADQAAPAVPGGAAGVELVDPDDNESVITFLPEQDLHTLREASDDDESVVTFLPTGPATEHIRVEQPAQLAPPEPIEEGEELGRMFTQEHAAQAANRYRLAAQLRERTEASRPPPRGTSRAMDIDDDTHQHLATHDFDVPTARAQETTARAAPRAAGAVALEPQAAAACSSAAKPQQNYALD